MKKLNLFVLAWLFSSPLLWAGGLVTNTNQSAAWARTLTREASLGVDAVYYNPAGLGLLDKGLHLSLSNQFITQTREVTSDYTYLSGTPKTFEANLTAPLFPSIYAAYKLDKWAFSAGFNIIGGGGSANFEAGLPSFEIPVASLVPMLQGSLAPIDAGFTDAGYPDPGFSNVTGYDITASFNGSSMYMGFQVGATYAINKLISVAIGARYVSAKNTYEGSLSGVTIDAPAAYGGTQAPGDYLRTVAGVPGLDATTIALLNGTATVLDGATADADLNAVQKGGGFTPIIGVNLHLTDMVNIAARYEHHTKIEMTNETTADDVGMFPDKAVSRADLPGMFSLGAQLKPLKKLTASVGFNYFLDRPAYYGNPELEDGVPVMAEDGISFVQANNETTIDANAYSLSASLEYKLLGLLGVSAGFSTGNLGVNDGYQSDLSYANKSNTVAGGAFIDVGNKLTVNAGVVYVMYQDYSKPESYQPTGFPAPVDFTDTFGKNALIMAVGADIHL
jgi:long-subunit fatty acid transport protein